jgi:hypothetical protein
MARPWKSRGCAPKSPSVENTVAGGALRHTGIRRIQPLANQAGGCFIEGQLNEVRVSGFPAVTGEADTNQSEAHQQQRSRLGN